MTAPAPVAPSPDPALLEAVDGLIAHAVEWAGLRLRRNLPRRHRSTANRVPAAQIHRHIRIEREQLTAEIFQGAFDRLPAVARRFGLDALCLRQVLEEHVRDLLVAGQPHDFEHVAGVLRAPCLAGRNIHV